MPAVVNGEIKVRTLMAMTLSVEREVGKRTSYVSMLRIFLRALVRCRGRSGASQAPSACSASCWMRRTASAGVQAPRMASRIACQPASSTAGNDACGG